MVVRTVLSIVRRNCHNFTPSPIPKPLSLRNVNALINTVQKQQTDIRELNNRLAKLSTNMHQRLPELKYYTSLTFSISCILVIFTVSIRT